MARPAHAVLREVSFRHGSAVQPLFEGLCVELERGFTGVLGPNGAGKTTLLRLLTGALEADTGSVSCPVPALYCEQRSDAPPAQLQAFLAASDARACALRGALAVEPLARGPWPSWSQGERKRAQIAVALWSDPPLLAIDEPTNHIDAQARELLIGALREYRGIGLLVSHDRELLDALCHQCLWLEPPRASLYPGGYSQAHALLEAERRRARELRERGDAERRRLQAELAQRREQASRSHSLRSKSGLAPRDHDRRERINRARVSGKDGEAGRRLRQLEGRAAQAAQRSEALAVQKQQRLGIEWRGGRAAAATLLHLPAQSLPLGPERRLELPELALGASDRIGISGANGLGKTRLIEHAVQALPRSARCAWVPQEIPPEQAERALRRLRERSPDERGRLLAAVSRLGSRPERLLASALPSPGELRKLWLALGLEQGTELIAMDEPTNHLDLPSIECLQSALESFGGALLLVSHDARFLRRLTTRRWCLARRPGSPLSELQVRTWSDA